MPGCGARLKATKDLEIVTSGNAIAVCGFDDYGAMCGLYNLIMRFSLREALAAQEPRHHPNRRATRTGNGQPAKVDHEGANRGTGKA